MDDFSLESLKKLIDTYLGSIFKIGIVLVILSAFFLFANLFSDIYETPKFLILFAFTGIILVLLTLKFTASNKVVITRTPLDIPFLLLLAVGLVSTFLSPSIYVSLLGNQGVINGSLISIVVYVLFYFILVNNLKGIKDIKWIFNLAVICAQILAVVTLLSYAGVKVLPLPWINALNFTPTGSAFSTTAILALLLPFIVMQVLSASKPVFIILNSLFLLLSGLAIALTGTWATWVAALLGFTLTIAAISPRRQISHIRPISLICLIGSIVLISLITVLSFIPPMGAAKNPIYTQAQNFPREMQLPFVTSWKISVSAFRDSPFWGSGPATYLFDFTNYKPVEFNSTKFWNLRFSSSFNEYLQILATLGGIGVLALLSLTALFVSAAYKTYKTYRTDQSDSDKEKTALAIAGIAFFIILALHPATLPIWIIGILILASFMILGMSGGLQKSWSGNTDFKSMFLQIAGNVTDYNASEETIKIDALPGVLLVVSLVLVLFAFFFGGKFALADYHHRLALNAVSGNQGILTYNELVAAEKLNPYNDVYRTDLAQTNFALANAIASAKAPTEASPGGSLTDQDKQNIQVLLSQSIAEGKTATTLSPRSSANWEILALLYRQISGVAPNALTFALDSYGRAIFQDPLNPSLRVSVGGVYYAIQNYDMAIRFFTDAINLKPDFANAYYNLSVALRDKGDLVNAQAIAEKALTLVDKSSPDYKTVSSYLDDLKAKIAAGSTQAGTPPPAAESNGSLQQKGLPQVVNLPKPEKIATPEAIKKPEATPTPTPTTNP